MLIPLFNLDNVLFIFLLIDGAWKTINPGTIMQDKISNASDMMYARVPMSEKEIYNKQEMIV